MSATAIAQISITGTTYTQNFDGMGGSEVADAASGTEQSSTLPEGWRIERNMSAPRVVGAYADASSETMYIGGKSMSSTAKNGTWNFGVNGSSDRALGGLTTAADGGTRGLSIMAQLHNDAGENYQSISLEYDIEKYRDGSNSVGFTVQLYTSTTGLADSWVSAGKDFCSTYAPDAGTTGYETVPFDSRKVKGELNVDFPANGDLYLAWNISVSSGNTCNYAPGLGLDNVSITPKTTTAIKNVMVITDQKMSVSENFNLIGGADVDPSAPGVVKTAVDRATVLPAGWRIERNMKEPRVVGAYTSASDATMWIGGTEIATNASNGTWNFGATGSDDRAIGGLSTSAATPGTRGINVMACLYNDSHVDIDAVALKYDIEKWRNCNNTNGYTVQLYTSTNGVDWTSAGLDFQQVYANESSSAYVNPPATATKIGRLNVNLPVGGYLYLAWNISVSSGTGCNGAPALAIDNVSITPALASNELFATYQKQGDTFYKGNGSITDYSDHLDLDVNYYIASCGQTMLLRAKTSSEDINFDGAGWATQLRVQNNAGGSQYEVQACTVVDNHHHYTGSGCQTQFTATTEDLKIHFFLNSNQNPDGAYRLTETFNYNRASINNHIDDNTAPTLDPTKVTQTEDGADLVFTFGDGAVTASEEFFYYVADKDHSIGNISLTNEVRITKPIIQDGTTYKFKCYAVDYNGNKSDYKEFTLAMPFDENVDLARNKPASAGAVQNDNTADRAVNGNAGQFWTCYGQGDASTTWWKVDLTNVYNLDQIKIHFNDINAAYNVYASTDNVNWSAIISEATATSNETKTHTGLTASARYLKVTSNDNRFGIKEFEVYASGIATPDETDPTVTVSCPAKTINTATLQIIAADEDDEHNAGTITSIKVTGDNGFVEQEVLGSLVENQITLSGLKNNKTYHFTITVMDKAGNTGSNAIEVVLPFDTEYNIAMDGTASAGFTEGNGHTAEKANDGNAENANSQWNSYGVNASEGGYANNWWQVQLDAEYNLSTIKILSKEAHNNQYVLEGSLDGSNYYKLSEGVISAVGTDEKAVAAPARYMRFTCSNSYCSIYEFEVYASGFSTLTDDAPVVTFVKVGAVDDATAEIEIDAADITTKPITTYMVSGLGGDPVEVTASEGKITLTSLSQSTHYTVDIQAKDESGNLSAAKQVEFTTSGSVTGLYVYSGYFGPWEEETKTLEIARFSTTSEPNVLRLKVTNMTAGDHLYKLYNATNTRCTFNDCGAGSDHYVYLTSAQDVYFYATDEDHFISSADNLYLRGSLVGEDQALVWNEDHTVATWSGALDLSGTKKFTIVKKNGATQQHVYDHDFYTEVQTFDGDYVYGMFTLDLTKMTGTWGYVELAFADEATNNTAAITENNGRIATVTINRDILANNTWYTLCLPFDLDADKVNEVFGASTIATLVSSEDHGSIIHLNFDYVSVIEAGKPYLIKPGQDFVAGSTISGVTIENVDPSAVGYKAVAEHMHFQGTFNKIMLEGEDKRYVSANNELYAPNPDGGSKIGAFRCYFTIPGGSSASAPGKRSVIVFGPQQSTGTGNVQGDNVPCTKVLMDGVLYIIRDGKTYNVMGMEIQ